MAPFTKLVMVLEWLELDFYQIAIILYYCIWVQRSLIIGKNNKQRTRAQVWHNKFPVKQGIFLLWPCNIKFYTDLY